MKKLLRMQPVIYLELEPNETQEQAEERLLNIREGVQVDTYTACIIQNGEDDENV